MRQHKSDVRKYLDSGFFLFEAEQKAKSEKKKKRQELLFHSAEIVNEK